MWRLQTSSQKLPDSSNLSVYPSAIHLLPSGRHSSDQPATFLHLKFSGETLALIKTTTGHLLTSTLASFLADIQTHSRVLQYVYHRGRYCKRSALGLALWRKWPCLDNGLSQRKTDCERERECVCETERESSMYSDNNVCLWKPLDNRVTGRKKGSSTTAPAVCICYSAFVPLKRSKEYKATSIRWTLSLTR